MTQQQWKNPVFLNAAGTAIELHPASDTGPGLTAVSGDDATQALFDSALAGAFGVIAPYASPAITKADLTIYAQGKQVRVRDGGIRVDVGSSGASVMADVATDADGRGLVTGCAQLVGLASQNSQPAPTFPWINNDGSRLSLTAAQIMTVGYAVGTHVQATYAALGDVIACINAGSITTFAQIDAASWPTN